MKSKLRIPIYLQYLISYALVLFIPLFIIGMLVYSNVVDTVKKQALGANELMLQQVSSLIDTKFSEMANISADLSSNPLISLTQFREQFYYFSMRSAMNYSLSNTFLHNVLLFDRERKILYSSESTYTLEMFSKVYAYPQWKADEVIRSLETLDRPLLRKAEPVGNDRLITYMRPIPVLSYHPTATAVFLIREQVVKDLLQPLLRFKGNEAFIIDNTGSVVAGLYESTLHIEPLITELSASEAGAGTFQWERSLDPVFVSYIRSASSAFTYVVVTPEPELLMEVNQIKTSAFVALFIVLLVGSILIYFSMRFNYNPIRRIFASVEQTWGERKGIYGFKQIESVLSAALTINQQMQTNAPYLKQSLLLGLLQGRINDKADFNAQGLAVGLSIEGDSFFVAVMQIDAEGEFYPELVRNAASLQRSDLQVMTVLTDAGLTLIISGNQLYELPKQVLMDLQQRIARELEQPVTMGVGTIYNELQLLTQSYIEASTAAQHKFIYGSDMVIFFGELDPKLSRKAWNAKTFIQNMLLHLERGSTEEVMDTAQLLVRSIRENSSSLFQAKSICIEVIHTLLWFVREHYEQAEDADAISYPDIISYANFNSIERLLHVTLEVCDLACSRVKAYAPLERKDSSISRIQSFIADHYADYHFSLQSMADELGLSAAYVSRLYKEATDNTVIEYVNQLRINKAKELLQTTDIPVKDIVEQIGYKDVSNFIRKFRQLMKLTPMEFRNHYRNGNGNE